MTTVVANSDGTIEHILEGLNTPEQVKTFLSKRYSILNQQAGSGYLTRPSKGDPGAIVMDDEGEMNPYINTGEGGDWWRVQVCVYGCGGVCVWGGGCQLGKKYSA